MIDLNVNESQRRKNIERCRQKGILLPTFAQMRDPSTIPDSIKRSSPRLGFGMFIPATSSASPGITSRKTSGEASAR